MNNNLFINNKENFEKTNDNFNLLTDEILSLKKKLSYLHEKESEIEKLKKENNDLKLKLTNYQIENEKKEKNIKDLKEKCESIPVTDEELKDIIKKQQIYIDNHINPIIFKDTSKLRYYLYSKNSDHSLIEKLFNELKLNIVRKNDLVSFLYKVSEYNLII